MVPGSRRRWGKTKKRQPPTAVGNCRLCSDGACGPVSRIRSAHPRHRTGRRRGHHLSGTVVTGRLKRPTCTVPSAGNLVPDSGRDSVLLGLSPRGVCLAAPVTGNAGALLPHPCTRDPDGPNSRRGRMVGAGLLSVARAVVPKVPTVVGTDYSARLPVRKRGALRCSDFPHRRACADRNGSRSGRNDGAMARSARHLPCTV